MTPSPSRGKGYQNPDCEHREGCLGVAAFEDWTAFNCQSCELLPVEMQAVKAKKTAPIKARARPEAKKPPRAGKTREAPHADPGEDPLRYKWKFMQRDPSYLTAWRRWKVFSSFSPPNEEREVLPTISARLAEEFGLLYLIDPETAYGAEVERAFLLGRSLNGAGVIMRKDFDELPSDPDPALFRKILEHQAGKDSILIDLSKITSLGELQTAISAGIVRLWKLSRNGRGAYRKDFDRVLQAGDLSRKGVSFDDIAKELFPDADTAEQWESAQAKVRQYLKTYERYCAGAWREL